MVRARGLRLGLVALAVAAIGGVYLGRAVRWRAIARTPSVSTGRFAEMVVSGVAVNNVLPGRVGDLLRARWLQVAARIPGGRALATVFLDRVFDVVALVAFLAVSLPFVAGTEWLRRIAAAGSRSSSPSRSSSSARASTSAGGPRAPERARPAAPVARDTVEGLADLLGLACASGSAASASPSGGRGRSRPGLVACSGSSSRSSRRSS